MVTKLLPQFQGKPIVEIPEYIPTANILEGDFGKAALEEYKGRVKSDYNSNSAFNVLSYTDNVVKGSNGFAVVLMNSILREEGLRTATPVDYGRILKTNALNLRGQYEDLALVLRSNGDNNYERNDFFAKDLHKQVKARGKVRYPVMIPLNSLELVNNQDSNYGLAFKLRGGAEFIHAPKLAHKNNHKKFSDTDKNGLPIFDKSGSRTLYTRDSGLSRLDLDRNLGLDSYWYGLDYSGGDGRVVIISGEATAPDFKEDLTEKLNEIYAKKQGELETKKSKILAEIENL